MKRIIVGLDPSTRSTGFAAIDPDAKTILHMGLFTSKLKDPRRRVKEIAGKVSDVLEGLDPECEVYVFTENSVMKGKGGATFQRCIGAIQTTVPDKFHLSEVQNSTVKLIVGKHGQADKLKVAEGAQEWLDTSEFHIAQKLIDDESWDITDAIAIAIAGFIKEVQK